MLATQTTHYVNGTNMFGGYPDGAEQATLGLGCFWGAERIFWKLDGVHTTSVGYGGGTHTSPDYKLVCSGATGHVELIHVVFNPSVISYAQILKVFFEHHDPTQGNRQGNDRGTQYRSAIYTHSDAQQAEALAAKERYDAAYQARGHAPITTEIKSAGIYYAAEDYHQQYLAKNPQGYCAHGPTGVSCPLPIRNLSLGGIDDAAE